MNEITRTCYMCNEQATSDEHVPPKCIFPEKKDLPNGVDLRKQLYTVPSCDAHNSNKSHDDEYFLYMLCMSLQINRTGRNQYVLKLRRAIKRNPRLLTMLTESAMPVTVTDPISGKTFNSHAINFNENRVNLIIDRMSRAIYYHHYKVKWLGHVKYNAELLFASVDQSDAINTRRKQMSTDADNLFSNAIFYGENPEIFKYQVVEKNDEIIFRLHFYENCKLLLFFNKS